jgi:hypothetical protein
MELKPRSLPAVVEKLGMSQKEQGAETEYRNFYMAPGVAQLEEPEKQKRFRKEYINEVGARPEPESLSLLADSLHHEALATIADRSRPSAAREELAAFYRRQAVSLQHKKYKMLGRWANQETHSQMVDTSSVMFDRMVGRLQKELDSAHSRSARLAVEDAYDEAVDPGIPRPQPTSKEEAGGRDGALLYVESPEPVVSSAIRQDDIEVHLRIQTYRGRLYRAPEKLAASIKWLPYSRRFDIWSESRIRIANFKVAYGEARNKVLQPVAEAVKAKLVGAGVADEKLLQLVSEKFTGHL